MSLSQRKERDKSPETMLNLSEHPHRRYNPLTREWVVVSPHRLQRPWRGEVEKTAAETLPQYDPECYLCPGNPRAGGARNPAYTSTFAFDNDYPALRPDAPAEEQNHKGLIVARGEPGVCRVLCFSPRHDLTLASMEPHALRRVVDAWVEQCRELGGRQAVNYVQIFENRGAMMGASNPHPHCQVWGIATLPNEVAKEQGAQSDYMSRNDTCLLCDYLALERDSERHVLANDHFAVLVPFWALWPFETLLLSKRHVPDLTQLNDAERDGLADILGRLVRCYDGLFDVAFPYSMGFHQRPTDGEAHTEWHLHAHFYPPLLRSATIRKYMVGFEMLGTPQRDFTPEQAAARLRETNSLR